MIGYLSKQKYFLDLTCSDGARYKLWWILTWDNTKALEKAISSFPQYDVELADWKDEGLRQLCLLMSLTLDCLMMVELIK